MANNVLDQDRRYNRTNPYLPVSTGPMTRPAIGRTAPAAMAAPTSAAAAPVPASQFVRPQVNAPKPTTFEGVNLEVPTSGPSVAYRAPAPVGNVTTPTVARTVPPVTTPELPRSGFAPIVDAFTHPTLTQPVRTAPAPTTTAQQRADKAYGNALFGPASAPMSISNRIGAVMGDVGAGIVQGNATQAQIASNVYGAGLKGAGAAIADAANASTYPARRALNSAQDFVAGVTGTPQSTSTPLLMPLPSVASNAPAVSTGPLTRGGARRPGGAPVSPPATPANVATAATPAAATTALDGGGTFNGRPVAELLRNPRNPISVIPAGQAPAQFTDAGAGIAADGTVAPAAGAPTFTRPTITRAAVRAPRGGIEFNDMFGGGLRGADNATAMANFQSEMRYGKYTPSARRAIAALAGQGVQFQNEQDNAGLKAVNDAGAAAAAAANEAALADSNNAAAAQMANAQNDSAERRAQLTQQPIVGEDGTVFTRNGSAATALTTADGKPVRAAPTAAQGQITAQDRLKALTEQLTAESSALQPNAERINALQGQIDALTSGGQQAAAPPEGAVKMLRENPAMAAQFDAKYGAGSAAKFLGAK